LDYTVETLGNIVQSINAFLFGVEKEEEKSLPLGCAYSLGDYKSKIEKFYLMLKFSE
jgi:hypothetical protein